MKVHVINIAENSATYRARRHVDLYEELCRRQLAGKYFTANFEHGAKTRLKAAEFRNKEIVISIPRYRSNLSPLRFFAHIYFAIKLLPLLILNVSKGDKIIVSSIPCEISFCVYLLSKIKPSVRYYLDVRDIWPDALPITGVRRFFFYSYCDFLNRRSVPYAAGIFYTNRDFEQFLSRYTSRIDNQYFIPLGADLGRWGDALVSKELRLGCVYVGNFNRQFDLRILNIARINQVLGPTTFIGEGELRGAYAEEFPFAEFTGLISKSEVVDIVIRAKYGLLPITGRATLPNKLYDYLLGGLDIITNHDELARMLVGELYRDFFDTSLDSYLLPNHECKRDFLIDYKQVSNSVIELITND